MLANDPGAEKAVLAALLANNDFFYSFEEGDDSSLFYDSKSQRIFEAAKTLIQQGTKADLLTIAQYFLDRHDQKDPDPGELVERTDAVTTFDAPSQLERLRDLRERRKIWEACQKAQTAGWDMNQSTDEAKATLQNVLEDDQNERKGVTSIADSIDILGKQIRDNRAGKGAKGFMTGFKLIDNKGGLHPGDLTIIAGETSQGKTALSMTIATNLAAAGTPIAIFSMEMMADQLTARIMAAITGINAKDMLYAPLSEEQERTYDKASETARKLPIFFNEKSTTSLDRIISSTKAMVKKQHIGIAIIDYLQILGRNQKVTNTEQFYGDASRRLKNLAKETGICVIALSQLSRDRANPEPTVSRLRASGQIEEAADNILLIYRPEVYGRRYTGAFKDRDTHRTAELILAKGRNIGTGADIIAFKPELTYFYDFENGAPEMSSQGNGEAWDDDEPF